MPHDHGPALRLGVGKGEGPCQIHLRNLNMLRMSPGMDGVEGQGHTDKSVALIRILTCRMIFSLFD